MSREYQVPINRVPFGSRYYKYVYACNGCGKPVEGYTNAKVYGKVWCWNCRKQNTDERNARKLEEHDRQVKANVLDELVAKFRETDDDEFAMFSLGFIEELAEQMKEQKNG